MGVVYNLTKQKKLRQHLKNSATDAERTLWSSLKNSQLLGFKFRRQQGIGRYIVDFYCPAKKWLLKSMVKLIGLKKNNSSIVKGSKQ